MEPATHIAGRRGLDFHLQSNGVNSATRIDCRHLSIAGWTGRDAAAVKHHVAELQALGVRAPRRFPTYYTLSPSLLTIDDELHCVGSDSSGEVEFVLVRNSGRLWVGVGSDHTDRKVEAYSVTASKQMCAKPVAANLWAYESVAPHWDRITLRSAIIQDGQKAEYQSGLVTAMRHPEELLRDFALVAPGVADQEGFVMFGGTLPTIGGIRASQRFEFAIEDPVLGRSIEHGYDVINLREED